jgi:hypothetical protein
MITVFGVGLRPAGSPKRVWPSRGLGRQYSRIHTSFSITPYSQTTNHNGTTPRRSQQTQQPHPRPHKYAINRIKHRIICPHTPLLSIQTTRYATISRRSHFLLSGHNSSLRSRRSRFGLPSTLENFSMERIPSTSDQHDHTPRVQPPMKCSIKHISSTLTLTHYVLTLRVQLQSVKIRNWVLLLLRCNTHTRSFIQENSP